MTFPTVRDWYLSALGVVQYRLRGTVPEQSAQPESDEELRSTRPRRAPPVDFGLDKSPPPKPVQRPEASPAPVEAPTEKTVHFRLAYWRPSTDLLVLDSLEPGQRPGPELTEMLSKMLKAIQRLDGQLPGFEPIDWPAAPNAPADAKGARDMLAVFMQAVARHKPYKWVLLMGESAAAPFAREGATPAVGDQLSLPGGARGIVTHSLSQMQADPALKKDTWQAIRFLAEG